MNALVIVPTYQEAESIGPLLRQVLEADPRVDVLVVDDASPDGTADLVAAETDPRVHLLRRPGKAGLGSAYRAGFAWGLDRGYDVLVEMDADLSHPPQRLPALLDALACADLALGSRWIDGGRTENWPLRRRLLSRGGNAYVRLALRLPVRDATSGFRAFRAGALDRIGVQQLSSNGYSFQVETVHQAVRQGLRVTEVPITFTERAAGTSKMSGAIVGEALLRVTGWGLVDAVDRLRRGPRATPVRAGIAAALLAVVAVAALLVAGTGSGAPQAGASPVDTTVDRDVPATGAPGGGGPGSRPPGERAPGAAAPADQVDRASVVRVPGAGAPPTVQAGLVPTAVRLPTIDVDAPLIGLGLAADGSMEVPTDFSEAGWLTTAAAPGERGNAVIAGHVDDRSGPAVFFRLRELQPGDPVEVSRTDGELVTYTVDRVERYPKDAFPTDEVFGPVPGSSLRLITCGGSFDPAARSYRDNIVVYASA